MTDRFYAQRHFHRGDSLAWSVWQRSKGGDRRLATHMSERSARKIARLLNENDRSRPLVEGWTKGSPDPV